MRCLETCYQDFVATMGSIEADDELIELLKSESENKNKTEHRVLEGIFEKRARIRGKLRGTTRGTTSQN